MTVSARGRIAPHHHRHLQQLPASPSSAFIHGTHQNPLLGKKDRLPVSNTLRGKLLRKIHALPHFLSSIFLGRHSFLLKEQGLHAANKWLVLQFERRIWPRIEIVNEKMR